MNIAGERRIFMVKAVVKNGVIVPRDPLPADWREGTEVEVEKPSDTVRVGDKSGRWSAELETADFWESKTIEEVADEQGVKPIDNPEDLKGDFWPEGESTDDFLAWLRELRQDGREEH
jgi:hypothetical protein